MNPNETFRPSAVIFDMDGLMLDTERPFIPLWAQAAKTLGYDIPVEVIHRMVGVNNEGARAVMLDEYGPDFPYDEIREKLRALLNDDIEKNGIQHKKGLLCLLDFLSAAKIPLAVATSTRRARAVEMLDRAGVLNRFSVIVAGDEVATGKPAPDIFLLAAEKLGATPSTCVGFEDSTAGLKALHAAGIRSVFIKDIVQPPPDVLAAVWRTCDDLAQAAGVLG